jgi:hypothetical protein
MWSLAKFRRGRAVFSVVEVDPNAIAFESGERFDGTFDASALPEPGGFGGDEDVAATDADLERLDAVTEGFSELFFDTLLDDGVGLWLGEFGGELGADQPVGPGRAAVFGCLGQVGSNAAEVSADQRRAAGVVVGERAGRRADGRAGTGCRGAGVRTIGGRLIGWWIVGDWLDPEGNRIPDARDLAAGAEFMEPRPNDGARSVTGELE